MWFCELDNYYPVFLAFWRLRGETTNRLVPVHLSRNRVFLCLTAEPQGRSDLPSGPFFKVAYE